MATKNVRVLERCMLVAFERWRGRFLALLCEDDCSRRVKECGLICELE